MRSLWLSRQKDKRPSLTTGPFIYIDMVIFPGAARCAFPGLRVCSPGKRSATGEDGGASDRHPPGRCCATFKSAPGGFVPTPESAHRQTTNKTKGPVFRLSLLFYLMPGNSLLSHGETPHYHRRYGVSLLSSAWGQVGPPRYRRQANSVLPARHMTH